MESYLVQADTWYVAAAVFVYFLLYVLTFADLIKDQVQKTSFSWKSAEVFGCAGLAVPGAFFYVPMKVWGVGRNAVKTLKLIGEISQLKEKAENAVHRIDTLQKHSTSARRVTDQTLLQVQDKLNALSNSLYALKSKSDKIKGNLSASNDSISTTIKRLEHLEARIPGDGRPEEYDIIEPSARKYCHHYYIDTIKERGKEISKEEFVENFPECVLMDVNIYRLGPVFAMEFTSLDGLAKIRYVSAKS